MTSNTTKRYLAPTYASIGSRLHQDESKYLQHGLILSAKHIVIWKDGNKLHIQADINSMIHNIDRVTKLKTFRYEID